MMETNAHPTEELTPPGEESSGIIDGATYFVWHKVQWVVDRLAIYPVTRWLMALVLLIFYVYRAIINQGEEGKRRG